MDGFNIADAFEAAKSKYGSTGGIGDIKNKHKFKGGADDAYWWEKVGSII